MVDTLNLNMSPAAVCSDDRPVRTAKSKDGPIRVGWFLLNRDVNSASVRYRCFHMARILQENGVDHSYFTSADALCSNINTLDAIIIVKRLDLSVCNVVAAARELRKVVFLDLCDDLLAPRYSKNVGGLHRMVFAGVARSLDGIAVPSAAMAERVKEHCRALATAQIPIHVIPDIAETDELFRRTAAFASDEPERPAIFPPSAAPVAAKTSKTVLWFGNFGAPHSNFGIASLLPAIPGLRAVHRDIPLELVVVSNDEAVYQALIAGCGVPTRYVSWSADAVYAELRKADVALLTNGDDEFCTIKSSNRVLQALAMGVPVVATASEALVEFVDCVSANHYETGLRAYLGPERERNVTNALEAANKILPRYRPERLAKLWLDLLTRRVAERKADVSLAGGRLLIFIETGDESDSFVDILAYCRKKQLQADVLVTIAACQARPQLCEALISHRLAPTVIASPKQIYPGQLHGVCRLIVESTPGNVSSTLAARACELGVPVQTLTELRDEIDQAKKYKRDILPPTVKSPIVRMVQPGPHPERLDPDGSAKWIFVVHQANKGWILDAICREIGSRQPESWQVVYNPPQLPPARNYFFSHYSLYLKHFRRTPGLFEQSGSFIWYTHPRDKAPREAKELLQAFEQATRVIFTCSMNQDLWLRRGLHPDKCRVVLGGADPDLFQGHDRGRGVIGLSSSFYERKNPDCLLQLVQLLPHRQFHLIGRKWEHYALFEEMRAAPNFTYLTIPYEEYPEHYRKFDVFLSISTLEGGPIPLLETMMCNAVPVASRTGFAPDLIRHGSNGFLFDIDAPAEDIAPLIEAAFSLNANVRETVVKYDWTSVSRNIVTLGR